jgi:hypothetical protein
MLSPVVVLVEATVGVVMVVDGIAAMVIAIRGEIAATIVAALGSADLWGLEDLEEDATPVVEIAAMVAMVGRHAAGNSAKLGRSYWATLHSRPAYLFLLRLFH